MWELDCEEGWAPKNCCFWTMVLEKTLASPLDCKEIQPVHSEGYQPWDFFGRNDAKAETPVFWPPHTKNWLIGKDSDAGRDWGQEEKGTTEDEMAGWHRWLDRRGSEWTLGVGDGQGGLACCNSWGRKELDMTEQLNWTELIHILSNLLGRIPRELTYLPFQKVPVLTAEWYLNFYHYPVQRRELQWTGPFLWVKHHAWSTTYTTYRSLREVTILSHAMKKLRLRKAVSLTQSHTVNSGASVQRWVFHLQNLPSLHFITLRSQF